MSIVAVLSALLGWLIADILSAQDRIAGSPGQCFPGGYKLLANKYFVDEIYGVTVVKPLLGFSKYILGWVVDVGILAEPPGCSAA